MKDFTLTNKVCHHFRYRFRLNGRVHAVLVVEVDMVCAQTAKRFLHAVANDFGPCIGYQRVRSCGIRHVETQSEFSCDNNIIAVRMQGFTQKFFVVVGMIGRSIDFGGVEESVAHLHGIGEEFRHFTLVGRRTVGMAHAHAAKSYGRYAQAA